ncbi:MAG: hypothetical protein WDN06_06060 [Asticcacaulis sp.]
MAKCQSGASIGSVTFSKSPGGMVLAGASGGKTKAMRPSGNLMISSCDGVAWASAGAGVAVSAVVPVGAVASCV